MNLCENIFDLLIELTCFSLTCYSLENMHTMKKSKKKKKKFSKRGAFGSAGPCAVAHLAHPKIRPWLPPPHSHAKKKTFFGITLILCNKKNIHFLSFNSFVFFQCNDGDGEVWIQTWTKITVWLVFGVFIVSFSFIFIHSFNSQFKLEQFSRLFFGCWVIFWFQIDKVDK